MKKIIFLSATVLISSFAFASRTSAKPETGSSVSVVNSGSQLVKVFYKALQSGNVTVAIFNNEGKLVYSEKIRNSDGFMRPYNFKNLSDGEYTVEITDDSGKQVEKINYTENPADNILKEVLIAKVPNQDKKFLISGFTSASDEIQVSVYDADGRLTFEKKYKVNGNFGEVYNLQELKGAFSISVTDASGTLKEYTNEIK